MLALLGIHNQREPKIDKPDFSVGAKHDVFGFNVPVNDILRMTMLQGLQELKRLKGYEQLVLLCAILGDDLDDVSACTEFHDEVNVGLVIVRLKVRAYVRVVHRAHQLNLSIDTSQVTSGHTPPINELDSHLHSLIRQIGSQEDPAKRSSTKYFGANLVLSLKLTVILSALDPPKVFTWLFRSTLLVLNGDAVSHSSL